MPRGAVMLQKRNVDGTIDRQLYNQQNLAHNLRVSTNTKILLSIVGGLCAGILGLTGLAGGLFYLAVMALAALVLVAKCDFQPAAVANSAKALRRRPLRRRRELHPLL